MGIADRDYMREPPASAAVSISHVTLIVLAVTLLVAAVQHFRPHDRSRTGGLVVYPVALPGAPGITIGGTAQSPYAANDPWSAWLAPESVCPGGDDATQSPRVQEVTALCLLNYARARQNLPALVESRLLDDASSRKAADILACRDFSHFACGKQPDANARLLGLTDGSFGENLYWGPEMFQPPRVAVDGWLNSEHHRENLFDPRWKYHGVAMLPAPGFRGASKSEVWVEEFSAP